MIKPEDAGLRRTPGANLINRATGEVVYTPPDGEPRIRAAARESRAIHQQRARTGSTRW